MTANDGYLGVTTDMTKEQAQKLFWLKYGLWPLEVLWAGTAWLVGPVPGSAPMFEAKSGEVDLVQGKLF